MPRMMRRRHGRMTQLVLALLVVCSARVVNAQSALHSAAVDVSGGLGHGFGGAPLIDRTLVVAALTVAAPIRRLRHGAFVVGVNASLDLLWSTSDCINVPNSLLPRCRIFPSYTSVGIVGGWSMRDTQDSGVRVLAGPAYIYTSEGVHQFGAITRVDAAERMTRHLSFVFWGQGLFPMANLGERHVLASGGIGLRVH